MPAKNSFINPAIAFGALALLFSTSILGGLVFGSLAVIFAALSKDGTAKTDSKAKIAISLGLFAIVLAVVSLISNINAYINDPVYRKNVDDIFMQTYGMTASDLFKELKKSFF
ncbi:MAG TPA: hypothetical protein DCP07_08135 [Lachnospiraceae bacterium]|nr:hypothetical protein [Lachnospiraceae bacterium]